MRLIDADILADEIESMKISVSGRPATFDEAKSDVMQVIDEQKTVDAAYVLRGMWISVKNRLPDSNGLYIVTACDEGCAAGEGIWYDTVVVTAEYYNGCWTWYEGGHEYDLDGIVTHWMSLPKPPEEMSQK